jgi:hypothetical protein
MKDKCVKCLEVKVKDPAHRIEEINCVNCKE